MLQQQQAELLELKQAIHSAESTGDEADVEKPRGRRRRRRGVVGQLAQLDQSAEDADAEEESDAAAEADESAGRGNMRWLKCLQTDGTVGQKKVVSLSGEEPVKWCSYRTNAR
eukprot:TRINITY_DN28591_c0_g1_i1.p3 TRINITY_DN28591_c0_g1~~TRINITY_DN28591_c0_g1_i1.p3  ORF type:complete len:113 (+),score=35.73 TRINITY_DN28591_c0_g1_i1:193-531(+)